LQDPKSTIGQIEGFSAIDIEKLEKMYEISSNDTYDNSTYATSENSTKATDE
jgi:hypothetical protein